MINVWFFIALFVGLIMRTFDGRVISVAVGLCVGILLSEAWKFIVWMVK